MKLFKKDWINIGLFSIFVFAILFGLNAKNFNGVLYKDIGKVQIQSPITLDETIPVITIDESDEVCELVLPDKHHLSATVEVGMPVIDKVIIEHDTIVVVKNLYVAKSTDIVTVIKDSPSTLALIESVQSDNITLKAKLEWVNRPVDKLALSGINAPKAKPVPTQILI